MSVPSALSPGHTADVASDIARVWNASPAQDAALADEAYTILDRATAVRRASVGQPEWLVARLAEGLARFLIARQMAQWGHRSYAIQALEASLDALRDAAAGLPDGFDPSRDSVLAFRESLHREWRAMQSEEDLGRLAALSVRQIRV
ncbi:MAG TPA: hypothetical protein VGM51_13765 [Armatimonadota bacterium]|jgi:hypothetical protein